MSLRRRGISMRKTVMRNVVPTISRKCLGVPHLTMFDVALLIPVIPVLAILISWWAKPDEFSTRRDVASTRLSDGTRKYRLGRLATDGVMRFAEKNHGALFLYCALVLWHFHARWWFIALAAVVGAGTLAATIIERGKAWRRDRS